ncbi:TapB family protein [Pseudozobellia thermophila]|uniref:DUF3108 domain-containing protein n=1 Tax=Pseudozobellia thermophila TaxID=192903 RepID=A0A1M6NIF9_9FLAO|nr:hypothetical protein [Pseudozobellia thermophila]SHJ95392.1 hypothetical protein SAMN04488513_11369 [Pseudozobellia thermophila]
MKTPLLATVLSFMICSFSFAQGSCSKFYPLEEGSSFEYTNYNKKGKVEGTVNYTVSEVRQEGSASVATFAMKYKDKKGEDVFETDYSFSCENGIVTIDYESLFPSQMMQQYTEMGLEMDISGTDIQLPNDLSVGQQLPDANVVVSMSMGGINMTTSVDQTNRKVEKKEKVTTPAGTFECYLLTEDQLTKTMGANIETKSQLWLAEGIGMVKQESYKKNGTLISRMELTQYSK